MSAPVLIEGLPGVGHVGKPAAEHLVEAFEGELVRRVYSKHSPSQLSVDDDGIGRLAAAGVECRPGEPAGGIVGTTGLLWGLGGLRGVDAACLLGETRGNLVDPNSARAVLEVLQRMYDFEVDSGTLEDRAEEKEPVTRDLPSGEAAEAGACVEDDLRYSD